MVKRGRVMAKATWAVLAFMLLASVLVLSRYPDDAVLHQQCVGFWVASGKDIDTADWLCEQEGR